MAEDLDRSRTDNYSKAPWLKIFSGFKLALDPKKLLLAGMGIFVAYLGWWTISWVFYNIRGVPKAEEYTILKDQAEKDAFYSRITAWTLLHELAGSPVSDAIKKDWHDAIKKDLHDPEKVKDAASNPKLKPLLDAMERRHGKLTVCPWNEDRGPNQFIVVSQFIQNDRDELSHGESNYFRFTVEPLTKFLLPVTYFFDPRAGGILSWNRIYLLAIMFWTIVTWGIFGGAITRIAAVQLARNEKVGLREALQFVCARWQGYVFAPVLPIGALLVFSVCLWVFGLFFGITFALGDVLGGLLWPITMVTGLIMAVIMVGLLGWPLMNATISTEGSDSFDALSRSYSYVYQVPWHCLGYTALSILYGSVLIFFVGFMGTLVVYLGNWGVTQAYYIDSRDPAFMCVHAPTSFGWRDALLKDSPNFEKNEKTGHYQVIEGKVPAEWYKHLSLGSYLVMIWLGLFFLLIIGFGYSYFWTTATIIYLLLRQKVDDTDLDEVYLEEEDDKPFMPESPAGAAPVPAPASTPSPASTPPAVKFTMVDLSTANLASAPEPPAPPPAASVPPPAPPSPDSGTPPPGM